MDTAVIELDALADPVRSAAQHHNLGAIARLGLAFLFVGGIKIRGAGGEFGGAGIHPLVDRMHIQILAQPPDIGFGNTGQRRQPAIGKALALEEIQSFPIPQGHRARGTDFAGELDQLLDLRQKPGIDPGQLVQRIDGIAQPKRFSDEPQPLGTGYAQLILENRMRIGMTGIEDFVETVGADFQSPQCLLHRFLEGTTDGHHLADRLHLRRQPGVGLREFLEIESRYLGHDVVDTRLERGGGASASNFVFEFVERVADRQFGGYLGDGKTGGLRRQRRGARNARIHLDDHHASVRRTDGELDIGAAGVHADLAQHRHRGIAHDLILLVGERLGRSDGDGIPGMHAHRIEIFDGADDDAVVRLVAHHLHLELLPAQHRFLDQDFADRRQIKAALDDLHQLLTIVGNTATAAAQGEGRPDDGRKTDLTVLGQRFLHRVRNHRTWGFQANLAHRLAEAIPILGHVDGIGRSADHFDAVLLQHAVTEQVQRAVQRGLAAHGR